LPRSWSDTLAYFGLRDDPAVRDRLEAGPTTAREVAALALALGPRTTKRAALHERVGLRRRYRVDGYERPAGDGGRAPA
jgi:hypothetical protein